MTHAPETDIEAAVADWYRDHSDAERVETQHYLSDVMWFVDIYVERPDQNLYIECESRADNIRDGTGQCLGYAGGDPLGIPMVVVPVGHSNDVRAKRMRRGSRVLIREFDVETGEWV